MIISIRIVTLDIIIIDCELESLSLMLWVPKPSI